MSESSSREAIRRRLFEVLERSRRGDRLAQVFEIAMVLLILANVAAAVIETVPSVRARHGAALSWFDAFCVFVFILEYALRLWTAPEHPALRHMRAARARLSHATSPMMLLDLAVILPFFVELLVGADFGFLRILRIFRFYRLARYSTVLTTVIGVFAEEWRALAGCAIVFAGLMLLSGSAMYIAEGSVQPDQLGDVPSAVWWAVVTLSTVGYGDVVPVTAAGKVVGALTMIAGIIFFALPVAIVATRFQQQIRRRDFVVNFAMVARVPLFARLDAASIARLVGMLTARRVAEDDVIITRGEEADAMYFIASGEVMIDSPSGTVVLSEGDFFGEIALIGADARRTADVIARRNTELLALSAKDFRHIAYLHPEIGEAVREVARQRGTPRA